MTLNLSLPPDAEAKLRERAQAAGQDISRYLEELIARELAAPLTLAQAAEPFARAVDAAAVSDDELASILSDARDRARRDRRR